mmetsp:Transcript_4801/g.11287  ORF Transcript_4801/g.11287 Transcript_4801/m.11287 type:complete len:485 (-) Transcript_4801:206-1660(-)
MADLAKKPKPGEVEEKALPDADPDGEESEEDVDEDEEDEEEGEEGEEDDPNQEIELGDEDTEDEDEEEYYESGEDGDGGGNGQEEGSQEEDGEGDEDDEVDEEDEEDEGGPSLTASLVTGPLAEDEDEDEDDYEQGDEEEDEDIPPGEDGDLEEEEEEFEEQDKDKQNAGKGEQSKQPASKGKDAGGDEKEKRKRKKKKKKKKKKDGWNEKAATAHSWVYVEGLPPDATVEEVAAHFAKCGVLAVDPVTQEPRVKLYRDRVTGELKGDASICYAKQGSVPLACQVLDGGRLRADSCLSVKRAEFNLKGGQFDPSKKQKVSGSQIKMAKLAASQALSWGEADDAGLDSKAAAVLKIVVLAGLFDPLELEQNPDAEANLLKDLVAELEAECGDPEKITLFARNPRGVVVVKFKTAFAAAECLKLMHGRFFAGRKLSCIYWDGVTDYTVRAEDAPGGEEKEEKRIEGFGDWIENQELPEDLQLRVED